MYTICFVVPYFGKLPTVFHFWLKSVEFNKGVDFLLLTDNQKPTNCPDNVHFINFTKEQFNERIHEKIGKPYKINNAYKLCDYRPAYGHLFENELKGYDFWGWCDIDLVFGNIRRFITDSLLCKYEKIGSLGHCVIVKNSDKMRMLYKQNINKEFPYKTILRSKENFSFDEGGGGAYGFPSLCEAHGIKAIWKRWFTDVYTETFEFRHKQYDEQGAPYYRLIEKIKFNKGILTIQNADDHSVFESMYVHFQSRKMTANNKVAKGVPNCFYMFPNIFLDSADPNYDIKASEKEYDITKKQRKSKCRWKKLRILFYLISTGKIFNKGWAQYIF